MASDRAEIGAGSRQRLTRQKVRMIRSNRPFEHGAGGDKLARRYGRDQLLQAPTDRVAKCKVNTQHETATGAR